MPTLDWWTNVTPATREWLAAHVGGRISWHILHDLWAVGVKPHQDDPARSMFYFTEQEWADIHESEAQFGL
jgi:hypothetical protein